MTRTGPVVGSGFSSGSETKSDISRFTREPPFVRTLELAFGEWVRDRFANGADPGSAQAVRDLATAVSLALHLKHTCLDRDLITQLQQPELEAVLGTLDFDQAYECIEAISLEAGPAPLVRSPDGQRIWLQKYYRFEQRVAQSIQALVQAPALELSAAVIDLIDEFYPEPEDPQRLALSSSLSQRFSVITGGPGTGKTWTIARMVALLKYQRPELRIELAAPTGKAANRMMESLAKAEHDTHTLGRLAGSVDFPSGAQTLHALLEMGWLSPKPRRHQRRPLDLDVLIVDEASMIDLPMMARLLDALPPEGQLILLGDKDQLSSVEAGGVLAELCVTGEESVYRSSLAPVSTLTRNYRQSGGPIIELAAAINQGKTPQPMPADPALRLIETAPEPNDQAPGWLQVAVQGLSPLLQSINTGAAVHSVLELQTHFQVLCALRNGPVGVKTVNRLLEQQLQHSVHAAGGTQANPGQGQHAWFAGLPVMVLRNHRDSQLFNGDIGIVLPVREEAGQWIIDNEQGRLRACFNNRLAAELTDPQAGRNANAMGAVKALSLAQMPPFESCYAMTVHKSQGSEYQRVLLLLPNDAEQASNNPVINRELLYTGITRARQSLELWSGRGVLELAAGKRTVRMSGLRFH